MNASDVVDLISEVLPPRLVKIVIIMLLVGMAVAGTTHPVGWYVAEKESWMNRQLEPVLERLIDSATQPGQPGE